MNLEERMKGVCLDCQSHFDWARFTQGHKRCERCANHEKAHAHAKLLMQKRAYRLSAATQYIINEQLLNATTKEST